MSKQTAVEWLIEHFKEYGFDLSCHRIEIEIAKAMEKQQMCQFAFDYQDEFFNNGKVLPIEQYYNETYGGDNE
jgi:hypothetical protein